MNTFSYRVRYEYIVNSPADFMVDELDQEGIQQRYAQFAGELPNHFDGREVSVTNEQPKAEGMVVFIETNESQQFVHEQVANCLTSLQLLAEPL